MQAWLEQFGLLISAAGGGAGLLKSAEMLSKHLLDKRKQENDATLTEKQQNEHWRIAEFNRLEERICGLESAHEECTQQHQECVEQNITLTNKVGELQGQVNGLTSLIARLESQYQTAVITCDEKGLISEWNSAASFMFGWSKEEAVGQRVTMIVPPRLRGQHIVSFNRAVQEKRGPAEAARLRESHALTKDGSEIPVTILLSSWEHEGMRMYSSEIRRR